MLDLVAECTGVDIKEIAGDEEARGIARERGIELKGAQSRFTVLNLLFETFVEEKLIQPTVIGHPTEISPLAKRDPENPDYAAALNFLSAAREVANAFSPS